MEMLVHGGWLIAGLVMLSLGADWLVRGSSEIALRAGVKPLIVGLTIVAFGTSAPELIVSLKANLDPNTEADIAVGNVIGSNICNIALLLGLAGLIRPFTVCSQVVKREVPILLGVTALFTWMIWDGNLARWEGIILACGIVAYIWTSILIARANPNDPAANIDLPDGAQVALEKSGRGAMWKSIGWIVLGFAGLVFGADRLVGSGVVIAKAFGVPEVVIGLTLVALGTSLPELATTIAAARRKETDIIAGNIIGSNLFNIMAVMGIAATVKPIAIKTLNKSDLMVMGGVTLLLVPFLAGGRRINRLEGGILLVGYLVYCSYLVKPEWFGVLVR